MTGKLKNYDPAEVTMVFGPVTIRGYADGTFINAERNSESFTLKVGADGEATRSKSNDRSGRVTFTLEQSSDSNALLSAIMIQDEQTNSGVYPLLIKDNSGPAVGKTLLAAPAAYIEKPPGVEYAKESGTREWAIVAGNLEVFVGGHAAAAS